MKTKLLIFSILVATLSKTGVSQKLEKWIESSQKVPVEKIYVHTNSEIYFLEDTIFLKTYLMDSRTGLLIPRPENIYLNIVDATGKSVIKSILLSKNGQASGSIKLPGSIKPGNYILQAYTDFLQNFDTRVFFHKILTVSGFTGPSQSNLKPSVQKNLIKNISFYPEGGVLLENKPNLVAFKAQNYAGYGVEAQGTVVDEQNNIITTFKTDFSGMGLFFLTPETGKKYIAKASGLPAFKYEFKPEKDKTIIKLINHTRKEVILNIFSNSEKSLKTPFYLVNMYRGEVVFYQEFILENMEQIVKFESKNLKQGINKLILLDQNLTPVSVRMLFSSIKDINLLAVTCSQAFKTKSKVEILIEDSDNNSVDEFSNLSVTVVPEYALPAGGFSQNILSNLFIGSEISSFTEPTSEYFNDLGISSDSKLRLLMLTSGTDNYLWNIIPSESQPLTFKQKAGLDLKGTATNITTGIPLQNSEITLSFQQNDEMAFLTQKTNSAGNFVFPGLLFSDTARIKIQAKNEKGSLNSDISLLPFTNEIVPPDSWLKPSANSVKIPEQLYKQKYSLSLLEKRSKNQRRTYPQRILPDKKITVSDGHFRLYEKADQVINVEESGISYDNVIDFITGKATGVDIFGDNIRIRGLTSFSDGSTPLFLIDGVPVTSGPDFQYPEESGISNEEQKTRSNLQAMQSVKSIPINDVEKIEILKSPQNLAIFGVKGANGVIAIYTQRGKSGSSKQIAKGLLERSIAGYSSSKKFYSPEYVNSSLTPGQNDFRLHLYWNPEVKTLKGTTAITFFSNDLTGRFKVFVEGISSKGRVCLGSAEFEVTR